MSESRFPCEGPPELLPTFTAAMQRVVDPEVALDIVTIGLVYGVTVIDGRVNVNVTMTSRACPVADVLVDDIEFQLDQSLPQDLKIHVERTWEPPWSPPPWRWRFL